MEAVVGIAGWTECDACGHRLKDGKPPATLPYCKGRAGRYQCRKPPESGSQFCKRHARQATGGYQPPQQPSTIMQALRPEGRVAAKGRRPALPSGRMIASDDFERVILTLAEKAERLHLQAETMEKTAVGYDQAVAELRHLLR